MSITKDPAPAEQMAVPQVYKAINAIQADLSKEGIGKDQKNVQQNYRFRGIDDIYNAVSPLLAKHNLVILPKMLTRTCTERETAKGGVLFYVTVEAEFDFVSSIDASKDTVRMFGEAMDSGDKATNKAMSAAFKYACIQTFSIPTEGDNDADGTTHEGVKAKPSSEQLPQRPTQVAPGRRVSAPPAAKPAAVQEAEVVEEHWKSPIFHVAVREGVNKTTGKPWKVYDVTFQDDRMASTFDHGLAEACSELIGPEGEGPTVIARVKPGKLPGRWELLDFSTANEEPGDDTGF